MVFGVFTRAFAKLLSILLALSGTPIAIHVRQAQAARVLQISVEDTEQIMDEGAASSPVKSIHCKQFYNTLLDQCQSFWPKQPGYEIYADECERKLRAAWTGKLVDPDELQSVMYPLFTTADTNTQRYPFPMALLAGDFPASVFWCGFSHRHQTRKHVDAFAASLDAKDVEHPSTFLGWAVREHLWEIQPSNSSRVVGSGKCHATKEDGSLWTAISAFFGAMPFLTTVASSLEFYLLVNYNRKELSEMTSLPFLYEVEAPRIGNSCSSVFFCRVVIVVFTDACGHYSTLLEQKVREGYNKMYINIGLDQVLHIDIVCNVENVQDWALLGATMQQRARDAMEGLKAKDATVSPEENYNRSALGPCRAFYEALIDRCVEYWSQQPNAMQLRRTCGPSLHSAWTGRLSFKFSPANVLSLRILAFPFVLHGNFLGETVSDALVFARRGLWAGWSHNTGTRKLLDEVFKSFSTLDLENERHGIGRVLRQLDWAPTKGECHRTQADTNFWVNIQGVFEVGPLLIPGLNPSIGFLIANNNRIAHLRKSFLVQTEMPAMGMALAEAKPRSCEVKVIDFKNECLPDMMQLIREQILGPSGERASRQAVKITCIHPDQVHCEDADYGIMDSAGGGCSRYSNGTLSCGGYDTSHFSSNRMCCACGGGSELGDRRTSITTIAERVVVLEARYAQKRKEALEARKAAEAKKADS